MKSARDAKPGPAIRILKSATCPSLSGKSKLSYEIGCANGIDIRCRIVANSASGSFSHDWVDVQAIKSALERAPRGATITSDALRPLFKGKSVNNQLFLFAVLKHEGLVRPLDGDKRGYQRAEPGEFMDWTRALIEGKGATTIANSKYKRTKPHAAAKTRKPAASTKSKKSPS